MALLPVRIETRFADANTTLHIRIFPDQVHLDAHEPAFTDDERAGAEWYWNERWPALDDAARAPSRRGPRWPAGSGPAGPRYLLDALRPANLDRAPGEPPAFPETARRASSWTRAVEATALPERWVAIGFQDTLEVFRIWSDRVPDRLAAGPSPDDLDDAGATRRRCPSAARAGRLPLGRRSRGGRARRACCSRSATATWPSVGRSPTV